MGLLLENIKIAPGAFIPSQIMLPLTTRELFETEKEIIEYIVKKGSAVIIGRCGFHIFREYPNHVKIFLHSGCDNRIQRVSKLYNLPEETAAKCWMKKTRKGPSIVKHLLEKIGQMQ